MTVYQKTESIGNIASTVSKLLFNNVQYDAEDIDLLYVSEQDDIELQETTYVNSKTPNPKISYAINLADLLFKDEKLDEQYAAKNKELNPSLRYIVLKDLEAYIGNQENSNSLIKINSFSNVIDLIKVTTKQIKDSFPSEAESKAPSLKFIIDVDKVEFADNSITLECRLPIAKFDKLEEIFRIWENLVTFMQQENITSGKCAVNLDDDGTVIMTVHDVIPNES